MRILIVLLAACHGAAGPPPASAPPTAYTARVGIEGESWTDFVIDDTGAASRALCEVLVASEQRGLSRLPVKDVYTRQCAVAALAAPSVKEPYVLVDSRAVDQESVRIDLMIAGGSDQLLPAHGTRTTRVPMNDRATCDAMKKQLDADDAAAHQATITATSEFFAQELEETKKREQEVCVTHPSGECDSIRIERHVLEEKQHAPPPAAPAGTRSCEPAPH